MNKIDFDLIQEYVEDEQITDINYNGKQLWIDHLIKGRYYIKNFDKIEFMNQLCYKIANLVNLPFNTSHPIVEAETEDLRISIIHNSVARMGHSLSIRKTPAIQRIHDKMLLKQKYTIQPVLTLLQKFVESKCNIIVSGLPGSGKTELVKYLTNFIQDNERVITIEDTLEIRYGDIHPMKDCVTMKVHDSFNYDQAIKASLRQRPNWILVSEVRSHEVVQLLQSISTGAKLISTLHTDQAASIPQRILHMFPGVELTNKALLNMIYQNLDIGIHLESFMDQKGIHRFIQEIVYFYVDEHQNPLCTSLYTREMMEIAPIPIDLQNCFDKYTKLRKGTKV